MKISVIVAMAINRAIGFENHLLWHIPEDLQHFKALTLGHAVIMGRKTFESLPCGALPQRRNIVISATKRYLDGCEVYPSVEKAIEACEDEPEVFTDNSFRWPTAFISPWSNVVPTRQTLSFRR